MLFFVDSCIPARQWTDICNTRCSILSRFSHFHVPQFHVSHFQRPRLQLPPQQGCCQFCCLVNRGTMGVNSLPKTVTRQRRDCDLNPGPSTLNTRLPSRPTARISTRNRKQCRVVAKPTHDSYTFQVFNSGHFHVRNNLYLTWERSHASRQLLVLLVQATFTIDRRSSVHPITHRKQTNFIEF